jgi:DNA-directed RNA polymerase specialized sigma24 family protein
LQAIALVARARRQALLRVNGWRLSWEDLEDCYSQAVLELLLAARAGRQFSSRLHIANALHQRFVSRIQDRRRALAGRSGIEAALASALPLGYVGMEDLEPADVRADVEKLVEDRSRLRLLTEAFERLSADQRLVLRNQLTGELGPRELCRREGWTLESHRKLAQRARASLRRLVDCPVQSEGVG